MKTRTRTRARETYDFDEKAPKARTGATSACSKPVGAGRSVQICAKWSKPGKQIHSHMDVCRLLDSAKSNDRESFYVVYVDARNRPLGVEEAAKGHLTGVEVHPRETFKGAILSNASAIFLAHNHPSGNPSPSEDDKVLTKRLAEAGQLLGIPVRDHVIIAHEGCTSLRNDYGNAVANFGGAGYGRRTRGQRAAERPAPRARDMRGVWAAGVAVLASAAALALAARA